MKWFRFLTKRFFIVVHLLVVALFLLACLVPYVNAAYFWPISFLGLAFPFLLGILLLFILFWIIFDLKYTLLSLVALFMGWQSIAVLVAFRLPGAGSADSSVADPITVLSYNVNYFKDFSKGTTGKENRQLRADMLDLMEEQHPDIACLQEFYTSEDPHDFNNREAISARMKLPYRYFSSDHNFQNNHSGVIIFSRYPILHARKVKLLESSNSESVVYADVVRGSDTLRVFTMHLQSVYLSHEDRQRIEQLKRQDTSLAASRPILEKLSRAFLKRQQQARTVAEEIAKSPYPVILCGDFNDTPNSYAYFKIRGKLQDAFLKKGWGIGPTYAYISPTLRIDYIFADARFRVEAFHRVPRRLSDHYPIVTQLSLEKKK
ncbi:endonuclease/exonuclease/phosphatase family protein [Compostibacter hankyongensis]|uniref:Endonuclease/exonuclease/phosphatase family protein n=1 Tax=Compostibacter hankyongensis TaxID=1007089 RepID=A0ABP8G590_9BACT